MASSTGEVVAPRHRRRGVVLLRIAFFLAVVAFAVVAIADQWSAVRSGLSRLSVATLAASLALVEVSIWLSMLSWRRLLADLGSPLPLRPAARIYFVGQLGKYLPGSVWPVLAQMELARDQHVPRARTGAAALVAIGLGLIGTLVVAGALLPFAVSSATARWLVIGGLAVSVVLASPPVLNWLLATGLRLLRRGPLEHPLSPRGLLSATSLAVLSWLAQGLAVAVLAAGLGDGGGRLLVLSVGSYAAASALGIVILLAPAGLGVREPALVAALAGTIGAGPALVVALAIRLVVSVADLGTGGILALRLRARSSGPGSHTEPVTFPPSGDHLPV